MKVFSKSMSVIVLAAIAAASDAAHWVTVSQVDASVPATVIVGSNTVRGARSQISVTIPSSPTMIYGGGTFKFYGEPDALISDWFGNCPTTVTSNAYVHTYYNFTYKWVSDSPSDIPPPVGSQGVLDGYSLTQGSLGQYQFTGYSGGQTAGQASWSIYFNSNMKVFTPVFGPNFHMASVPEWPASTDSPIVAVGSSLFFITPEILGGGSTYLDANGNTVLTASILNSQNMLISTPTIPVNNASGFEGWQNGGTTARYVGGATLFGLPITG
jgi:hypothetical protein